MLVSFLKSLLSPGVPRGAGDELPVARSRRIKQAHAAAPIAEHLRIAFGDMRMGNEEMLAWMRGSLADAETLVDPLKALHRPLAAYFLARYFLHALRLDGALAECGVYQGASALALCRAARAHDPGFTGARLHLVDSFAGLAAPTAADMLSLPGGERAAVAPGTLAADEATARKALAGFPQARIHKGWIPQVFGELPETRWAFVHVDVDFHDATLACLEYFYPKLAPGGVMVCDDYGSAWFPGAFRAWDRYCDEHGVPFVVLDTGQAVILKS